MTRPAANPTRVLVGASSFVDASAALTLLSRLTDTWQTSIGGVLVEDTASTAICALPNQRVISPSGTIASAPSLSQIRTLMKADARAFEHSLARLATDAGAPWTFERGTGDLIQTGLFMAKAWDILILGYRTLHPIAGKVVLLQSSGAADSPMMEMSKLLSARSRAESVVLTVNKTTGRLPHGKMPKDQTYATLQEALGRLARLNAQAVLVDLSLGPVHTSEDLRRLIEVARCPVFVFGTVSAARLLEHKSQRPTAPKIDIETGD